jgi:hypothetical protein
MTMIKREPCIVLLGLFVLMGLTGCSTSKQVSQMKEQSGFLGDYSMLREGKGDEANYVYVDPAANWKSYNKVLIRPVELWRSEDSDLLKLSPEDQKMLVDYLHASLRDHLSKEYEIVDKPGPGVLVIRAAVTDAKKAKPVVNIVSSVVPVGMAVSFGKEIVTGTGTGVGAVAVEAEFLDGQSNQRVAAAMDARAGTKALRSKGGGKWGDVKLAFDYWSQRVVTRLAEEKAKVG